MRSLWCLSVLMLLVLPACSRRSPPGDPGKTATGPSLRVDAEAPCRQTIDGFGTTGPYKVGTERWVHDLYYDDLGASILRVDLTPAFRAPYSDFLYNSPWFHKEPALPGPDGNNVRTYTDASDYGRTWAGRRAAIAVMGPDLEKNVALFDYDAPAVKSFGTMARRGAKVPGFKLMGSLWSPPPWLKKSSGGHIEASVEVMPKGGTPWPFIWNGNFAGGVLDTSDEPRKELDDKKVGGTGPTSALTQLGRAFASFVLGFQRKYDVRFHAISIQNELNFETFYNSCSYPRADGYVKALKAVRKAFDAHPELKDIQLMGPEDLIGTDAYALWQFGADQTAVHKNLQYVRAIASDPEAQAALGIYAVHAYAADGVSSSGNDPQMWRWWMDGWDKAPAEGLPDGVAGVRKYGKRSWMTESSGEKSQWVTHDGSSYTATAFGLALKIHHALTAGEQNGWIYWQITDGEPLKIEQLTDDRHRARAPKYVAAKHYFKHVRPGMCRVDVALDQAKDVHASAYRGEGGALTLVVLNASDDKQALGVRGGVPDAMQRFTSDDEKLWDESTARKVRDAIEIELPPYSVTTLVAKAER